MTYEGDNNVMYLQTARYLFKNWHGSRTSAIKPLDARWCSSRTQLTPNKQTSKPLTNKNPNP